MTKTDINVPELVINTLTNAEYEAAKQAGEISSTELYMTTDDPDYITEDQLENKQDLLISGTNIKTINNQSLLGSGNIDIQGGGSSTAEEIVNANESTGATTPLKVWQGTEQQWTQGESTTWYNWKTNATISTTQITVPSCAYINIKYTKDRYIALDYNQNNKYYYSFDGDTWLEGTFQSSQWWGDVCYGNGIWVALGSGSNFYSVAPYIAVSSDGINWTNYAVPSPITESLKRIAFGNGVFVLIGSVSSNQYAFYSTDGINWSQGQNFSSGGGYCDITFGNNFFWTCAGTGTQGPFMNKSSDGINWESVTAPSFNGRRIIYKDNKIFCLAGQDGSRKIYYSLDNGNSWSNFSIGDSGQIPSQCGSITYYNGTLFIGTTGLYYTKDLGNTITGVITGYYPTLDTDDINNVVCCCASSSGGITSSTTGFYFTVDSFQSYTLDQVPTTSSEVYSTPGTESTLTITAVDTTNNTITLSDNNVYNRNSAEDTETYRSIGEIHPDYICNINNIGVKIGNITIADNTTLDTVPTQGSTNAITSGAVYEVLGNLETALYNFNSRTE